MTPARSAIVAVTQRVAIDPRHGERRDALDQRWARFLGAAGLVPLLLPNSPERARELLAACPVRGLVLTGGDSLVAYGGATPERDATEAAAVAAMRQQGHPIFGVCRGMQLLLDTFGVPLEEVQGHAGTVHVVSGGREVNSYHTLAAREAAGAFRVVARAEDGVVEAVMHSEEPIAGVMWHPERADPFDARDLQLVRTLFGVAA